MLLENIKPEIGQHQVIHPSFIPKHISEHIIHISVPFQEAKLERKQWSNELPEHNDANFILLFILYTFILMYLHQAK